VLRLRLAEGNLRRSSGEALLGMLLVAALSQDDAATDASCRACFLRKLFFALLIAQHGSST
jgi:hypothetical protein